jgi:fructosamine-3-kinase
VPGEVASTDVDLAYLRAHPEHLTTFLTHQRIRETPVHGGSINSASRLTLEDGASIFLKTWPDASSTTSRASIRSPKPDGFFEAEAAGLHWLRVDGGAPIPAVIVASPQLVALEWLDEGRPTADAARAFGAALAATHRSGAPSFGAPWPGFVGALPLDNTEVRDQPWSRWFAARRLEPYLRISSDRDALSTGDVTTVERVLTNIGRYAGEADGESPARVHGDLWPGNVLWSDGGPGFLIDPAAHGGHRETDLAELALFGGAPFLTDIVAGYQGVWPLSDGWQSRVPLHQLHLLLVHTAMFGGGYRDAVMSAVRATVEQ